jgi:hypothetical protein
MELIPSPAARPTGHRLRLRLVPPAHTVSPAALDRFAQGIAAESERGTIVRHLFAGCADCKRHLAEHWGAVEKSYPLLSYDSAFERIEARVRKGEPPFDGWDPV